MALSIDDLFTPLTEDQVLDTFLDILRTFGIPVDSWVVGGVARTILRVVARTYSGFTQVMALFVKAGFLESATGPWLTLLARNVFGVERVEATFATGAVTMVNSGGGVYGPFAAGEVNFLWPAAGKVYTNTDPFTLNPGATLTVNIEAVELGSASSAVPGAISAFQTPLLGVTVSNAAAVVGTDAQSDPDLRTECRNKLAAISVRGPRGAYAYAVTAAVRGDGTPVDINRASISPSSSTGVVTVYVASASGVPSPSDIQYVVDSIESIARPDSVTCNVLAATAVPYSANLTVWAKRTDGVTAQQITDLVNTALINAFETYPVGGIPKPPSTQCYLYAEYVAGVVQGAHASIYDVDGAGSDVALSPGQVATLATPTITVRIVDVP